MHRLIVALLAAFDGAVAVAAGLAATLAPLTVLWVFGLGDTADWSALWPAGAVVWQLGHLVPLAITLPGDYLAATGIDESAASFTLSLAPLAFATFTAIFAARSGVRASRADAWNTGVLVGTGVVGALATLVALGSQNAVARAEAWQAALFPTLVFAVPALVGALVTEWREAGAGVVARARDRLEALPGGWGPVAGVAARSAAAAVVGLVGVGALVLAVALFLGAGDVVSLYQAGNLDALGAIVVTLAQFAYLPTLVVWSLAFVAGPGFGLGEGSAISPAGTQVGVVPGVPVLGALPESGSPWLLLLGLLPIAVGAFAGWIARSRLLVAAGYIPPERPRSARSLVRAEKRRRAREERDAVPSLPASGPAGPGGDARRATLDGLLAASAPDAASVEPGVAGDAAEPETAAARGIVPSPGATRLGLEDARTVPLHEPLLPRLVVLVLVAGLSAATTALLAVFASGSLGPGRLGHVGPEPGPLALTVGLEVLVGAGILLLSSRRGSADEAIRPAPAVAAPAAPTDVTAPPAPADGPSTPATDASTPATGASTPAADASTPAADEAVTAPIALPGAGAAERPSID